MEEKKLKVEAKRKKNTTINQRDIEFSFAKNHLNLFGFYQAYWILYAVRVHHSKWQKSSFCYYSFFLLWYWTYSIWNIHCSWMCFNYISENSYFLVQTFTFLKFFWLFIKVLNDCKNGKMIFFSVYLFTYNNFFSA